MPPNTKQRPGDRPAGRFGTAAGKAAGKAATGKAGKGGRTGSSVVGKGRKAIKPVRAPRPWGLIALGTLVALVAGGIIGYPAYQAWDAGKPFGERRVQQIEGMTNFRAQKEIPVGDHVAGKVTYPQTPPVGGKHNSAWQNCQGDIYPQQIANEHAVHSMEHGAVWVAYRPDLPKAQVDELAKKVKGQDYLLMSPYPGLSSPIMLQAWGFQLPVDTASDKRIDKFIKVYRQSSSVEPGATCSQGVTATGTTPQVQPQQPQQPPQQ